MNFEEYFKNKERQKKKIDRNVGLATRMKEQKQFYQSVGDEGIRTHNLFFENRSAHEDPIYGMLKELVGSVWGIRNQQNSAKASASSIVDRLRDQFNERKMKKGMYLALLGISRDEFIDLLFEIGRKYWTSSNEMVGMDAVYELEGRLGSGEGEDEI